MYKEILIAYAVTVVSEVLVILAVQKPKNYGEWITAIVLINSFTHPIALYFLLVTNTLYLFVEFMVVLIEAFWYVLAMRIKWKRALVISFIANIVSILAGVLIRILVG